MVAALAVKAAGPVNGCHCNEHSEARYVSQSSFLHTVRLLAMKYLPVSRKQTLRSRIIDIGY